MTPQLISYQICIHNPHKHILDVVCTIHRPDQNGQVFSFPLWIPGSYLIRDFVGQMIQVQAFSTNQNVVLERVNKNTWKAEKTEGPLYIKYQIYAFDNSVRSAFVDDTYAFFNGTSVFIEPHHQENAVYEVEITKPNFSSASNWQVSTTMPAKLTDTSGFGVYTANDFDMLCDHPVLLAESASIHFEAKGVPHEMVIVGHCQFDAAQLTRDLQILCERQIEFFEDHAPFERYLFITFAVQDGYGGLEHRSSTALICKKSDLPLATQKQTTPGYRRFLGLCSHEYFHAWNVKRLRPKALMPLNYNHEMPTTLLWVFEGITSYYDDLFLARSGLISTESYLELLSQTITRLYRTPGRRKQTLLDASYDAWSKFYKPNENTPNASVSYYIKGSVVALCLDLFIRTQTNHHSSLDTIMRAAWDRFGKPGIGLLETDFEQLAEDISGISLKAFFDRALRSTDDLDLAELFMNVSIECVFRPPENLHDEGGKPSLSLDSLRQRPYLGAQITRRGIDEAMLGSIYDDGSAICAGLYCGDILVALNHQKVTFSNYESLLNQYKTSDVVHLHVFRRDQLLSIPVTLLPAPHNTCMLTLKSSDNDTSQKRDAWLKGKTI